MKYALALLAFLFIGPAQAAPNVAWDQKLRSDNGDAFNCDSTRFKCIFDEDAVLDKETGVVWQIRPISSQFHWSTANVKCLTSTMGNRQGWRLPNIHELRSLITPDLNGLPTNPFDNVFAGPFWSSTVRISGQVPVVLTSSLVGLNCQTGLCGVGFLNYETEAGRAWCVRGPFVD